MEQSFLDTLREEEFEATCGVSQNQLQNLYERYCGQNTPIPHK